MRRFEAYEDENGRWRWRLWNDDRHIVATSGEAFGSQFEALLAGDAVRSAAAGATLAGKPGLGIAAAGRLKALLSDEVPDGAPEVRQGERPRLRAVPGRRVVRRPGGRARLRPARR
jgi:uncharacterized protein YegP (UPF0339 family)